MGLVQPIPPELAGRARPEVPGVRETGLDRPDVADASALLFDNLKRGNAARVAVHAPGSTLTYGDLCAGAAQFGHGLLALGLRRGERVLLLLDDSPYAIAAFFGAIRAGLVPVLLDPNSPADQIQFAAADSDALAAIVDAQVLPAITSRLLAGTRLSAVVAIDGEATGREPMPVLPVFPWLGAFPSRLEPARTHRDDMAFWRYAPGLTGRLRAIVHHHHHLAFAAACHVRPVLGLSPGDRCLSFSPWHTAAGLCATLAYPFAAGASSVTRPLSAMAGPSGWDPLADVLAFTPSVVFGEPGIYASLLLAAAGDRHPLHGVRSCIATSPLPDAGLSATWRQHFGQQIIEGLGSPETLCAFISGTPDVHKPGKLGRRVPGFELQLMNGAGQPVPDGTEGVLWVRGRPPAPSYWNSPEETAMAMAAGGWFMTGERLTRDVYGFYARPPAYP